LEVCKICGGGPRQQIEALGDGIDFDCENCGSYHLAFAAIDLLRANPRWDRRLIAHLIRKRARENHRTNVTGDELLRMLDDQPSFPNAFEQVENLLVWLAEKVPAPGQPVGIDFASFQAVIGCSTPENFRWVVREARKRGWVQGDELESLSTTEYTLADASLTLEGWEWYESIGRHKKSRVAFMAMQYGVPDLDRVVREHFVPGVAATGFELRQLRDRPEAGVIDNRLRVEIRRSRFLVCDVTHGNRGAYWEAGFAEGLGIPVIYTCERRVLDMPGGVHFDTRNCLVVPWSADRIGDAVELLKATVRNTLPAEALLEDPT
jgi:hypothetical protein